MPHMLCVDLIDFKSCEMMYHRLKISERFVYWVEVNLSFGFKYYPFNVSQM